MRSTHTISRVQNTQKSTHTEHSDIQMTARHAFAAHRLLTKNMEDTSDASVQTPNSNTIKYKARTRNTHRRSQVAIRGTAARGNVRPHPCSGGSPKAETARQIFFGFNQSSASRWCREGACRVAQAEHLQVVDCDHKEREQAIGWLTTPLYCPRTRDSRSWSTTAASARPLISTSAASEARTASRSSAATHGLHLLCVMGWGASACCCSPLQPFPCPASPFASRVLASSAPPCGLAGEAMPDSSEMSIASAYSPRRGQALRFVTSCAAPRSAPSQQAA